MNTIERRDKTVIGTGASVRAIAEANKARLTGADMEGAILDAIAKAKGGAS